MKRPCITGAAFILAACGPPAPTPPVSTASTPSGYLDYAGRDDALSGGARMIPITTPKGMFHVWTKRVGNNPKVKVLLLHGGPGADHEDVDAGRFP